MAALQGKRTHAVIYEGWLKWDARPRWCELTANKLLGYRIPTVCNLKMYFHTDLMLTGMFTPQDAEPTDTFNLELAHIELSLEKGLPAGSIAFNIFNSSLSHSVTLEASDLVVARHWVEHVEAVTGTLKKEFLRHPKVRLRCYHSKYVSDTDLFVQITETSAWPERKLRIWVGTFNVGNSCPPEDLSPWIDVNV